MPFSSQPRKKGNSGPQDGTKKPSCGSSSSNVIDLPTEKKKLAVVQEKIAKQLATDPKAVDKAAFVIAEWINGKTKKSK